MPPLPQRTTVRGCVWVVVPHEASPWCGDTTVQQIKSGRRWQTQNAQKEKRQGLEESKKQPPRRGPRWVHVRPTSDAGWAFQISRQSTVQTRASSSRYRRGGGFGRRLRFGRVHGQRGVGGRGSPSLSEWTVVHGPRWHDGHGVHVVQWSGASLLAVFEFLDHAIG